LKKLGITTDGVKTTPLSGQPDVYGGTNPQVDSILQASIEHGYAEFIGRVAAARKLTPQRVDEIGQGRVWDGGTARQLGLVDRFGSLDDAVAEAAKRAGIDAKNVRRVYLEKQPGWFAKLVQGFADNDDDDTSATDDSKAGDLFAMLAAQRQDVFARALGDAKRLATVNSVQARCLECAGFSDARADNDDRTLAQLLIKAFWQ
jgi:protease-4